MIDLTPLDVRNKRGDFKKLMRGYDPQEVDVFLELVAERLEQLTRENIGLKERAQVLQQQVDSQADREQAVQEALVTAQELRADIRGQAQKEANNTLKEAETEARRLIAEAEAEARTKLRSSERRLDDVADALQEMERRRKRFLKEFRQLLERELDVVDVEEEREPLEDRTIDLDLGVKRAGEREGPPDAGAVEAPRAGASSEASAAQSEVLGITITEDDFVPPPDAPVDELAAAYESAAEADASEPAEEPLPGEGLDAAPPAPKVPNTDNFLLYLDTDDEA